jgi:hypothetical protein
MLPSGVIRQCVRGMYEPPPVKKSNKAMPVSDGPCVAACTFEVTNPPATGDSGAVTATRPPHKSVVDPVVSVVALKAWAEVCMPLATRTARSRAATSNPERERCHLVVLLWLDFMLDLVVGLALANGCSKRIEIGVGTELS